jgi:plastocyanin
MGIRTKYLQLVAATTFAFSMASDAGRTTMAISRESGATTDISEAQSDLHGDSTISGTVKLAGPQAVATHISMAADPACLKAHPAPVISEEVVTGANGALKNVIVYISDGLGNRAFDPPKELAVFDQKGCSYSPHILGMRAGQTLRVTNSDPTTHNIHPVPQNNREWNMSQPPLLPPIEQTFAREEIIPVKCNIHPWMRGYIAVFKHPYFAVTDKNGSFDLKNVPPGEYTIQAWHEKYGVLTQKVNLAPNQSQGVEFVFKPRAAD